MKFIKGIILYILLVLNVSCGGNVYKRVDDCTLVVNGATYVLLDSVYLFVEDEECMCLPQLDSIETEMVLRRVLALGILSPDKINGITPSLFDPGDMSMLPYYLNFYQSAPSMPECRRYIDDFVSLCTARCDDQNLYNMCKNIVGKVHSVFRNEYTDFNELIRRHKKTGGLHTRHAVIENQLISIDSLRVRVVAHNDRDALAALEKYYHDKGDDKGIAIYYKVMLSHDGNGDLAERFYRVLEPYFEETPEFRIAVREVLLRAALCDHNARAQELCDSQGYSLCDYKLPKIE